MKSEELAVDPVVLREEVKTKYRNVAMTPGGNITFIQVGPLRGASVMIRRWLSRCPMRRSSRSPGWQTRSRCNPSSKVKESWMPDRVVDLTALSPRIRLARRVKSSA